MHRPAANSGETRNLTIIFSNPNIQRRANVSICMDSLKTDCLRAHYRGAFQAWAFQVKRLHAAVDSAPGQAAVRQAEERVASAEVTYRELRNQLTGLMITRSVAANERQEQDE